MAEIYFYSKTQRNDIPYSVLKKEYLNGKSLRKIESEYGINRNNLSGQLKKDGVIITGNNPNQPRRYVYQCNENFFQCIDTEEKAYILGFFLADGSFIENGIKFDQTQRHKRVLEFIKTAMEANQEIKTYEGRICHSVYSDKTYLSEPMCRLSFSRIKLKNDLMALGLLDNKTYNFNDLNIPEMFWNDFMRGYFDGDGSATQDANSFTISYTIKNFDLAIFIMERSAPYYQFKIKQDVRSNSYTIYISNYENALAFFKHIYHTNMCFCLDYKYQATKKILGN